MKTLFTFFATLFLFASVDAKVVYLNNQLTAPVISENLFTNWADAYAATSSGDTIYVVGSSFSYGRVAIEKPLSIIGPGFFLDKNPNTQLNKQAAMFDQITLNNGTKGTLLKGISIVTSYGLDLDSDEIDNITIENVYCSNIAFNMRKGYIYENISIKKCFTVNIDMSNSYEALFTNLVLTN